MLLHPDASPTKQVLESDLFKHGQQQAQAQIFSAMSVICAECHYDYAIRAAMPQSVDLGFLDVR